MLGRRPRSRPRSRLRPGHEAAASARVVAVDRGRYTCLLDDDTVIVAMRARELGRRAVAVGDVVAVVGDLAGGPDSLARVVRVEPRTSVLRRTADDDDPVERVVVANADQLVVVTALADPPPRPGLVDRCLVAAHDAGLSALLCLTKRDLAAPDALTAIYDLVGVDIVVTGRGDEGRALDALRSRLLGRTSVLVGHSGVGKSTLVNALVPDAEQRVGLVNAKTGRGRHTTTAAIALPFPGGGWVIDTPGIRSFGLAHVARDPLVRAFPDLAPGTAECPSDCDHLEPGICTLDEWVAAGYAHPERLESLRRLLIARDALDADTP